MDERKIRARLEAERERLLSVRRHLLGDPRRRRISRGGASREHRLTLPTVGLARSAVSWWSNQGTQEGVTPPR